MMILFGIIMVALSTLIIYGTYLFIFAFMMWMIIDAGKQDRFWWVLLILGVPLIGALVYYFTEKKHEYAKAPAHHVHTSQTEAQHEKTPHGH